jgi:pimeloyl-ACP methyl ester carboxylesterase
VINWRGQTVSAAQHLKLLDGLPVLLAWGSDDRTIPPRQYRAIAQEMPTFHTAEITGAGHYPQETAPDRLLPSIQAFLPPPARTATTSAAGVTSTTPPAFQQPPEGASR